MKNFLKLAFGIDVIPALRELAVNQHLWNENNLRTTHPASSHTQVDDIWLWFNKIHDDPAKTIDDIQVYPYPAWEKLRSLREMILNLIRRVDGVQLGRCIVTRMRPGSIIAPHVDEGTPATFYTRYQIVLQSQPGALFTIGDETVNFCGGEAWWINNRERHGVVNNSAEDRIVCIVDIRSA